MNTMENMPAPWGLYKFKHCKVNDNEHIISAKDGRTVAVVSYVTDADLQLIVHAPEYKKDLDEALRLLRLMFIDTGKSFDGLNDNCGCPWCDTRRMLKRFGLDGKDGA